jgi:hypothetical protein
VPAAATLWLLASPFVVGAAIGRWHRANRFVARHYWPALALGWLGVALFLAGVFALDPAHADLARVLGGPLAGLSFWSRAGGGDDSGGEPEDDQPPDAGVDWEAFTRDFGEYAAQRSHAPAQA